MTVKCRTRSGDETASIDAWIHSQGIEFKSVFLFLFCAHTIVHTILVCVCAQGAVGASGVQVMWIEIHQNQQSVVMKAL